MLVGFTGSVADPFTKVFSDEMQKRGIGTCALSEVQPDWQVDWVPLRPKKPLIRGVGLGRFCVVSCLRDAARNSGLDVLHVQQMGSITGLAALTGFRPLVMSPWGSDVLRLGEWSVETRVMTRLGLTMATAVTCCAPHIRDAVVSAGANESACHDIGWGVDEEEYRPDVESRCRIRAEWGVTDDDFVFLSTRKLDPLYRVDKLIEAFAIAQESIPRAHLVIASYGIEKDKLAAQASSAGCANRIRFLGRVPNSGWPSMADVYRGGDAYCSIPWSDGAPLSVLEAMATGLPVVASDLPSMRQWVSDTRSGLLWDGQTVEGLARLMGQMARGEGIDRAAPRTWVMSNQRRKKHMDRLAELYADLTMRGKTQSR